MAYGARLESGLRRKLLEGSNPSPSANLTSKYLDQRPRALFMLTNKGFTCKTKASLYQGDPHGTNRLL